MSIALCTLVFLGICFFTWRNFMKNKELAISIAASSANKYNLKLLDDAVYLHKINIRFENKKILICRIYSFDYNVLNSDIRFRAYIMTINGKLHDVIISDFEKASVATENITLLKNPTRQQPANNIINFD